MAEMDQDLLPPQTGDNVPTELELLDLYNDALGG
jgi:hypothetical protein